MKVKDISERPVYVWTWRFENKREMDWYYSLVLGYKIELESLDFRPSDECEKTKFFSREELEEVELCEQTNKFKEIFNPEDFK